RRELTPATWESVPRTKGELHLQPSHFIPVDGRVLKRLMGDKFVVQVAGLPRARQLYDAVDNLMKYGKPEGQPWGRGDALWACDSHYGNCTDFHSIFIGACRDLKIPAKFEMGFSIPEQRGAGKVSG
ncbi:MAG: transglutaminase-like domain-containing protein, partial [Planctomycetota bacterium]|nr:transglutaminase-like domain-containing protein [Planctomycetota bacterium]